MLKLTNNYFRFEPNNQKRKHNRIKLFIIKSTKSTFQFKEEAKLISGENACEMGVST